MRPEDTRDVIPTRLDAPIIITGMARLIGQARLAERFAKGRNTGSEANSAVDLIPQFA
jgi:hypothetical protein